MFFTTIRYTFCYFINCVYPWLYLFCKYAIYKFKQFFFFVYVNKS